MIIKADKEAIERIKELCDIALKVGGLQNFTQIGLLLNSLEELQDGQD